jgi:hypothetical protein
MSAGSEDWYRAGFRVISSRLVKVKTDAKRIVSEAPSVDVGDTGHPHAGIEIPQDTTAIPQLPHSEQEELQDGSGQASERSASGSGDGGDETGNSGMDREGRSAFRISVTLYVSNYGRRDPIGAFETICDLVTATRRRLSERFSSRDLEGPVVRTGKRGRKRDDRKTVKGPLPF